MIPRPLSNPPNPWLSTEVEYLEEIPPAELEVYEDHTREILSHNDSPDVGFSWSVNPYRGCFHACAYCMAGGTPILMGDGTTRSLADVRAGDVVYGTVLRGMYRRYARTPVLAHWQTLKQAFRVTLEDGTTLIASGDHRFLTQRGWKYVTGLTCGAGQRPHLTAGNSLPGTGAPCIVRKRDIEGRALKNAARLRVMSVEPLGIELPMYDITTGTGDFIANGVVSHNCYARPTHEYLGFGAGTDFDRKITVKPEAPRLLREAFERRSWEGELPADARMSRGLRRVPQPGGDHHQVAADRARPRPAPGDPADRARVRQRERAALEPRTCPCHRALRRHPAAADEDHRAARLRRTERGGERRASDPRALRCGHPAHPGGGARGRSAARRVRLLEVAGLGEAGLRAAPARDVAAPGGPRAQSRAGGARRQARSEEHTS